MGAAEGLESTGFVVRDGACDWGGPACCPPPFYKLRGATGSHEETVEEKKAGWDGWKPLSCGSVLVRFCLVTFVSGFLFVWIN